MRWYTTQEECHVKRANFHKLLASDVCKSGYGETVDAACAKANLELRASTVLMCTAAAWWRSGEVYRLYTHVTDSYILLGVLILAPILYTIKSAFDFLSQRSVDDRVERLLQTQQQQGWPSPLQALPSYNYGPQRTSRMRSNFVYNPYNRAATRDDD
jgi:hypothetical protein